MTDLRQFVMPFAEKDEVETSRVMRILGVSRKEVLMMLRAGDLEYMRKQPRGYCYISYASLVRYCDQLREKYAIDDHRPKRDGVFGRHKDVDLLPFPLSDTMSVADVARVLNITEQHVRNMCESGTLVSYKLEDGLRWRISMRSFHEYLARLTSRKSSPLPVSVASSTLVKEEGSLW